MPYAILAVVLVIADQVVKFLIRSNLELGESVPFIPHVLNLTYYQNTGAAFSLFREHTWILALISAVVSVALVVVMSSGCSATRWDRSSWPSSWPAPWATSSTGCSSAT